MSQEAKRNNRVLGLEQQVFEWSFLTLGLLVQVVTYWISTRYLDADIEWLSLCSGCMGVCSVCLCAQGRISTYIFGFAQVLTYLFICLRARLYGEVAINIYYFFTMIYGVWLWRRRLNSQNDNRVKTRRLSLKVMAAIVSVLVILSAGVGWLLDAYTDDPTPYLDAFTTLASVVAQLLMIQAFRNQWFLWLAVDVTSTVMWIYLGDWCMAAQYIFWCCNCLYGYYRWASLEAEA